MKHDDRRQETRLTPLGLRGRMRGGHALVIVNVSSGGALVEAGRQLRPGARIEVHLETDRGRRLVRATVNRCAVAEIHPHRGILYRAALCFTERCEWVREAATHHG